MVSVSGEAASAYGSSSERSHKAKTPAELTNLLAKTFRGSSMLLIALLDLEEEYVMTRLEASAISEPAARMLMRIKALRKPLKLLTSNSDEIALLVAIGSYGIRLYPAVAAKLDQARSAAQMAAINIPFTAGVPGVQQQNGNNNGVPGTSEQTTDHGRTTRRGATSNASSNGNGDQPDLTPISGIEYSAYTEPLEAGHGLFG